MTKVLPKPILFVFINLALLSCVTWANNCPGCVDLDDITFEKTIKRFPYALVKFDIAYPYGEKHEAFAAFAKAAHAATDDLLIATVGVKDYGENENKALAERFEVDEKNYPAIFLFRKGEDKPLPLPSHLDISVDSIKTFVSSNTDLYIGREGCLKQFNDLAKNFANLEDSQQQERLAEGKKLLENFKKDWEMASSKTYITFMEKIMKSGYKFVEDETRRLLRLRAGKVSQAKKAELNIKLNILEAFRVNKLTKEEL
ncbi:protein windbeutel [Lucilia cuprina]|uniref:protein windbeutel n=1 Tax=Lucilia cuprina TaxID=7375 RepID=UPI001F061D72|nr:protein windbeutel [Lucilia cuprina]